MLSKKYSAAILVALTLCACGGNKPSPPTSTPDPISDPVPDVSNPSVPKSPLQADFSTTFVEYVGSGGTITLDPSLSTSTSGPITLYKIEWGDGQTTMVATPTKTSHTYTASGSQNVTLTVLTDTGTNSITKVARMPTLPAGIEGYVALSAPISNQIVRAEAELVVPNTPNPEGVLSIWPGLMPHSSSPSFNQSTFGLIQPVLVWGGYGCGTVAPNPHTTWWIQGYVYDSTTKGCSGGNIMSVSQGQLLKMDMSLNGTIWTQLVTNVDSGATVSFSKDLNGQAQNVLNFAIELKAGNTGAGLDLVTFKNVVFSLGTAQDGEWCNANSVGPADVVAAPKISNDKKTCSISKITLKTGPKGFKS